MCFRTCILALSYSLGDCKLVDQLFQVIGSCAGGRYRSYKVRLPAQALQLLLVGKESTDR